MRKRAVKILSLLMAALTLCLTALPASAEGESVESAVAATMQLMKTEGTVGVTNSSGRGLTKRDNMRLYNGYHVGTEASSYAWISLDSEKLAKLDEVSEAEVRKSGKKLEMLLSSGNLYFNVAKPLEEDETLNVRTSTMAVGIRGTSGWIRVIDRWSAEIYVLEGTVEVTATDPVTGETKTAEVQGGETAIATAYPQERQGDKCDILRERFEVGDIDGFVLMELAQDPGLCGEILEESGLDVRSAAEAARERLERDQREMREKLDGIEAELARQDNNVSTEPVWERQGSGDASPGASGASGGFSDDRVRDRDSGGTDNPPAEAPREPEAPARPEFRFRMPMTAAEVQQYLNDHGPGTYTLLPSLSGNAADNTLTVDTGMTIPSGTTLILAAGVNAVIPGGGSLTVYGALTNSGDVVIDGTMSGTGTLTNNGSLTVNSANTLSVDRILNNGSLTNTGIGRILAADSLTSSGALINDGGIEGLVAVSGGTFAMNGGTVNGPVQVAENAAFTMNGGEIVFDGWNTVTIESYQNAKIAFNGGTITNSGDGYALFVSNYDKQTSDITFGSAALRANRPEICAIGIPDTFDADTSGFVRAWMPEGYTSALDSDGCYHLVKDNANAFDIMRELRNAKGGETIELPGNITAEIAEYDFIYGGTEEKPVVLDLNGHTLTVASKRYDEGGYVVPTLEVFGALRIKDSVGGGKLILGGIDPHGDYEGDIRPRNSSYLFLESGSVSGYALVHTGSAFTMTGGRISDVYAVFGSAFYMDGGEIISSDRYSAVTCGPESKLYLNGGSITNQSDGYALAVRDGEKTGVIFGDTLIRAKRPSVCAVEYVTEDAGGGYDFTYKSWLPSGWTTTREGEYYRLGPGDGEADPDNPVVGAFGTCGESLTWTLSGAGNLTISGTGPMEDYNITGSPPPWYDYRESVEKVAVEDGVTGIGNGAFTDCYNLTSAIIPDSVTSIGLNAFSWCTNLTKVSLGAGITSIGDSAFYICRSLRGVDIPEGVTSIGESAFSGCGGLTSVTIPDSVTSIGQSAFYGCGSLTSVTIPEGVTSIERNAFSVCASLEEVTIPAGVTSIGIGAFEWCGSLREVTIPEGVTSIGQSAFSGCASLEYVAIPYNVAAIEHSVFQGCTSLKGVDIPDGVTSIGDYAFYGCASLEEVTIPASVTEIGIYAFSDCASLEEVTIPASVTSIAGNPFGGCASLTGIEVAEGNTAYRAEDGVLFRADQIVLHIYPAGKADRFYEIPDGVVYLGADAFKGCVYLEEVTIPDSVIDMDEAFWGCGSLISVTIPSGVTDMLRAFYECGSLRSVTISEGVTSIGHRTFLGCASLEEVTIPASVTTIGVETFYGCGSLTDVYYGGDESQWREIFIFDEEGNAPLLNANIHYNSTGPEDVGPGD